MSLKNYHNIFLIIFVLLLILSNHLGAVLKLDIFI
jgi:hypothetical protein